MCYPGAVNENFSFPLRASGTLVRRLGDACMSLEAAAWNLGQSLLTAASKVLDSDVW